MYAKCLHSHFTAIGNAYAVLSNPEKRQQYDQYGDQSASSAPQQSTHSRHGHYRSFHRDFEADISPEELFNIFFGGRFPTGMSQLSEYLFHLLKNRDIIYYLLCKCRCCITVSLYRKCSRVHQPGNLLLSVLSASSPTCFWKARGGGGGGESESGQWLTKHEDKSVFIFASSFLESWGMYFNMAATLKRLILYKTVVCIKDALARVQCNQFSLHNVLHAL